MKSRRRLGASAAGAAVALLAVPFAATPLAAGSAAAPSAASPSAVHTSGRPLAIAGEDLAGPPPTTTPPPPATYCPVQGAVEFVDSWGAPRRGHRHEGVDMLAARGTPVVAPVAGLVTTRDNRTGGLSYHLYAADGTYYYGTHLGAYGATGEVAAGTVIGYIGDTGNARGTPHLHFEIHPGGEGSPAVNPYPTVAAWCGVA